MGLANFQPAKETIRFKSGAEQHSFDVRALTLPDLTHLVSNHLADIREGFVLFERAKKSILSTGQLDAFIVMCCNDAPLLVAEVISVAADEPDLTDSYAKLPFGVQAYALSMVTKLTLEDGGGLKNLAAMLTNLYKEVLPESAREALASLKTTTQ